MRVQRMSLAVTTEVGVWADRALVTITDDGFLARLSSTERTIAEDHLVTLGVAASPSNRLGKCNEVMAWMIEWCLSNTDIAVIKVGAARALVTDALDGPVALVAQSIMGSIAARTKLRQIESLWIGRWCWKQHVVWVVSMRFRSAWIANTESLAGGADGEIVIGDIYWG